MDGDPALDVGGIAEKPCKVVVLRMTLSQHARLKEAAKQVGKSMNEFAVTTLSAAAARQMDSGND